MHYLDTNENRKHGTDDFPVGFYHVDESHPRYEMPFHWHRESELIRVLEGSLQITLDDHPVSLSSGETAFIAGGVVHGGNPHNCAYECVVFDLESIFSAGIGKQLLRPILKRRTKIQDFYGIDSEIQPMMDRLLDSMIQKRDGYELSVLGILCEFFGLVLRDRLYRPTQEDSRERARIEPLKPVLEFIETAYSDEISLEQLARLSGMSPKYFCRYFRAVTQKTPFDYLNFYRIERACCLLDPDGPPVAQVGYQCGFNDASYFIRIFKKYKGITPKQYVKQIGEGL